MKHLIPIVALSCLFLSSCQEKTTKENKSTAVTDEWISLFDGKSLNGWHQYNGTTVGEEWSVVDNTLVFDPSKKRNYGDGGKNIVTDREFTSFVLSIEWNVAEAGNSGLFWGVKEGEEFGEPYLTGPEIQILDNERHPDALANPKYHQAGALYDMVQPTADVCKPAGEWNHVILTVNHNNNKGSVVLNGTKIIEFPCMAPNGKP